MATPKYKMSRANTHTRRSAWRAQPVHTEKCSHCGEPRLSMMACPHCGFWRGRVYEDAVSKHMKVNK